MFADSARRALLAAVVLAAVAAAAAAAAEGPPALDVTVPKGAVSVGESKPSQPRTESTGD